MQAWRPQALPGSAAQGLSSWIRILGEGRLLCSTRDSWLPHMLRLSITLPFYYMHLRGSGWMRWTEKKIKTVNLVSGEMENEVSY